MIEEKLTTEQQVNRIRREQVEYLQNVSHQLVAPLNAIKWHIENLTAGRVKSTERIQKVLRSIYSQATIAVHLAKNFALMSNLETDHELSALKEPLQPVNLCQLLVNLADDFQPLGWDKELQIRVDSQSMTVLPEVLVMRPLISQVFSNIVENAVKYSASGTEISIVGTYEAAEDMVEVSIVNSGLLVRREDAVRIFERGYRTDEAKRLYPAGTGFGLYIAKRIAELHEGDIKVSGDAGRVVFTVTLPTRALEGKARQRDAKSRSAR